MLPTCLMMNFGLSLEHPASRPLRRRRNQDKSPSAKVDPELLNRILLARLMFLLRLRLGTTGSRAMRKVNPRDLLMIMIPDPEHQYPEQTVLSRRSPSQSVGRNT